MRYLIILLLWQLSSCAYTQAEAPAPAPEQIAVTITQAPAQVQVPVTVPVQEEVKPVETTPPVPQGPLREATDWDKKLVPIANKEGVPAPLLAAVCYTESKHKAHATNLDDNGSSSIGLCQVKYATAKMLGYTGTVEGLYDGKVNAKWAARYIKYQLDRYPGEWHDAIAAYNAGSVRKCNPEKKYFIVTAYKKDGSTYKKKKACVEGEHINQKYIDDVMGNILP